MSVFGSGIRPWKRQTEAKRAADTSVPGKGELVVSDAGKVYAGDGTTQAKNLSPMLRKTDADATYAPQEEGGNGVIRFALSGDPDDPDITLYASDGVTEL